MATILDAVESAADGRPVRVYRRDGRLVAPPVIRMSPLTAAATNWHALSRFAAARWRDDGPAMLIDVGSSTCDVLPLHPVDAMPDAATDAKRLSRGELIYLGVERTPVCALVSELPLGGEQCAVARELFATTQDIALLLKHCAEDEANRDTADGQPATKAAARRRMSRMVCADDDEFNHRDAVRMAQTVWDAMVELLATGMQRVAAAHGEPRRIVLSGHGEHLACEAVARCQWPVELVPLSAELGPQLSRSAPAHALAVIANEGMQSP